MDMTEYCRQAVARGDYNALNDLPPTPYSQTPTGLLSPDPSDHSNDPPKPKHQRNDFAPYPTRGPTAEEIFARLERLKQKQQRNGVVFKLGFDDDYGDSVVTPDPNEKLTPIVPSSPAFPLSEAERIFINVTPRRRRYAAAAKLHRDQAEGATERWT